ncbi:hypothetical protein ACQCSU_13920 [Pseudarthrobacter sp. O4]|uniref:hypothetical protein n=1 Tax=Pseudarthrobacter sp. O4 TaxID=3418417 RepID=UPI003CEE2EDB
MSETPEAFERRHSEAPAEGDPSADVSEIRVHAQDPAEGADFEDTTADSLPAPETAEDGEAG